MTHVVTLFSGGVASWGAAMRVAAQFGADSQTLLFTDTRTEDQDLYRFLHESATVVGSPLVIIEDGRDVWDVFDAESFIGNTRVDICSRILKRDLARRWIDQHYDPTVTKVAIGIDIYEIHRFERARPRWQPYDLIAPLTDTPYLTKHDLFDWLNEHAIERPRLYDWSAHNNCGGFCVKAGHAQFRALLLNMPDRYAYHEAKEQDFRKRHNSNVAILRDRTGGTTKPLTLAEFRQRVEHQQVDQLSLDDWGGCGCMVDE